MATRKALVVGVSDYQNTALSDTGGARSMDVDSPVPDAVKMKKLLEDCFNFAPADIELVTDAAATADAIRSKLDQLVTGAVPGDFLAFYFQGHGVKLIHTEFAWREKDLYDEVLCCHDMDWLTYKSGFITDDELDAIASRLQPGVTLETVIDGCAAGGMYERDEFLYRLLVTCYLWLVRLVRRTVSAALSLVGLRALAVTVLSYRFSAYDAGKGSHIVWAASAEDEGSNTDGADQIVAGKRQCGLYALFTHYFDKWVRARGGIVHRDELLGLITADIKAYRVYYRDTLGSPCGVMADQNPELDCKGSLTGTNVMGL